jgi:hypothetical protein|tara:strand:+ start:431 stop:640 length:210 start_codon:yes stop_codon:yes gene_type:complete
MNFEIKINMDQDSFKNDDGTFNSFELTRLLLIVIDQVTQESDSSGTEMMHIPTYLVDSNGNNVGNWKVF